VVSAALIESIHVRPSLVLTFDLVLLATSPATSPTLPAVQSGGPTFKL